MSPNLNTAKAIETVRLTRAERFARWLLEQKAALMPKYPRRFYGQNVVVRVPTPMIGKLYARNGAKECARRRKQMGAADAKK